MRRLRLCQDRTICQHFSQGGSGETQPLGSGEPHSGSCFKVLVGASPTPTAPPPHPPQALKSVMLPLSLQLLSPHHLVQLFPCYRSALDSDPLFSESGGPSLWQLECSLFLAGCVIISKLLAVSGLSRQWVAWPRYCPLALCKAFPVAHVPFSTDESTEAQRG